MESSSDSAQSVEEEYFRVHMFHNWDENYRPEVVRQRVEAWRSRGLRQGRDPDIHGLSGTENASVQMMVGYFRYERPRSSHSSTPSPPVLRVILASPEVSHEPLSYLQPVPSAQGLRAAALSAEVPSGDQANLVSGYEAEDLESLGAWEVEMPEMETTTELVEEASQEHYAVSMSVRRLRHDLEGILRIEAQQERKAQLEDWLSEVRTVCALSVPGQSADAQGVSLTGEVPADTFLHTRTVAAAEVRKELPLWVGPAREELESLFERTEACQRIDEQKVQQWVDDGQAIHILPGKAVCTRKAGIGKRRFRAVVCGNYMPQDAASQESETFASGVECISVRCAIAFAARQGWRASCLDIRTAFLNAPARPGSGLKIVVKPPRLLVELGLVPEAERWLVAKALYGLTTSPRDWSIHRNEVLRSLKVELAEGTGRLRQGVVDEHVWQVISPCGKIVGLLIVYVDDLLCLALPPVASAVWKAVQEKWQTTPPAWASVSDPISFCGVEIYQGEGRIWLRQTRYLQELLDRYQVEHEASLPMNAWTDPEPESNPLTTKVKSAQKVTGELLWLTNRSRPDLVFSVGKLSQWSTKAPEKVLEWSQQILKYLKGSKDLAIVYGLPLQSLGAFQQLQQPRRPEVMEVYAGSSHAPQGFRSQQCAVLLWQGDLVAWDAGRQPFTALSSAEAELVGMLHAMTIAESVGPLFEEFQECDLRFWMLGDNTAACRSFEEAPCNWRSRHLRFRAAAGRERVQSNAWTVMHVPGIYQLADLATKPLPGNRLSWLLSLMNVVSCPEGFPVPPAMIPAPGAIPVTTGKKEKIKNGKGVVKSPRQEVSVRDEDISSLNKGTRVDPQASVAELTEEETTSAMVCQQGEDTAGSTLPNGHSDPRDGVAIRQQQAKVALVTIILAGLCSPTMSSREVVILDSQMNSTSSGSLQETGYFMILVILVIFVWEVGKWLSRKVISGRNCQWYGLCRRRTKVQLEAERFTTSGPDRWEVYSDAGIAMLLHHKPRRMLFDPEQARLPFPKERLTGIRMTMVTYLQDGEFKFVLDRYSDAGRARHNLYKAWVGRTVFILR